MNDPRTAAVPTHPAIGSPMRRPAKTRTTNPTSGNNGMRNAACNTVGSALQNVQIIGRGVGSAAEDCYYDAQPDHHFSCRHYQDEERDGLPADVVEHAG